MHEPPFLHKYVPKSQALMPKMKLLLEFRTLFLTIDFTDAVRERVVAVDNFPTSLVVGNIASSVLRSQRPTRRLRECVAKFQIRRDIVFVDLQK